MSHFTYILRHTDGREHHFEVDVERAAAHPPAALPLWAALDFHRCMGCPLGGSGSPACPAAVDLIPIVEAFADTASTELVEVEVRSPQRSYQRRCDVQTALRSLIGLVMGSSGCPEFAHLRAMARSHLPFASRTETAWRLVATWLLAQHFEHGGPPDLDALRRRYARIRDVNVAFAGRIRAASRQDASANAIAALSSLSSLVSFSLDDDMDEVRRFLLGG